MLGGPRGSVTFTMATMVRLRHTCCDIMVMLQKCTRRHSPKRREQTPGPGGRRRSVDRQRGCCRNVLRPAGGRSAVSSI